LDHIELLGDSLHFIAENKAGIIKEGRPAVIGVNCFPETVFEEKAKLMNSKLYKPMGNYQSFEK
jgi:folylpolyglutamate synthase/dihydropteroate synthase